MGRMDAFICRLEFVDGSRVFSRVCACVCLDDRGTRTLVNDDDDDADADADDNGADNGADEDAREDTTSADVIITTSKTAIQ